MAEIENTRIDKWLWAVRIFKSRALAADACASNKVKIDDKIVKASYSVKVGQTINVNKTGDKLIYKVSKIIDKRVGAPLALLCYEDLTPPENKNTKLLSSVFFEIRDKGIGRPTKKDRRNIVKFKETDE